jgi:hypothetical protein
MDLLASDRLCVSRIDDRASRDNAPLFADGLRTADHNIVKKRSIKIIAVTQSTKNLGKKLD